MFRFTTNPGLTFAQYLALRYGQMPLPNELLDDYRNVYQGHPGLPGPGGLNYAEGRAKANSAYSVVSPNPEGVPIALTVQLQHDSSNDCQCGVDRFGLDSVFPLSVCHASEMISSFTVRVH